MAFDTRYMLGPNLQDFLIDAQTGLPMTDGVVFFYSDINRNVPKAVYTIAGNQANYTFTNIGATVQLSAVGTTTDNNGNDIKIYYLPYAIDANGNITDTIENYFVQVYDMNGNLQFTRENWPGLGTTATNADFTNFSVNGQFLFHNNNFTDPNTGVTNPVTDVATANGAMLLTSNFTGYGALGAVDIWQIAPGGWTYERSHGSTATDTITFPSFGNFVSPPPESSPRYSVQITRSVASTDAVSDLRLRFMDVNKFQNTTQYLYFTADALSGSVPIQINLIQYFGTGGTPSPTISTPIETITATNQQTVFVVPINFTNYLTEGESVGTNNDDYVQIAWQMPGSVGSLFSIQFSNIVLSPQILSADSIIAAQSNGNFLEGALFNTAPNTNAESSQYYAEDGSQFYLPMVMTSDGMTYDYSLIGSIVAAVRPAVNNELLCDGTTYLTSGYSALGIPYYRLQKVLFNSTTNSPIFGTGVAYVNAEINSGSSGPAQIILSTNQPISQAGPTDGTNPTGFNFSGTAPLSNSGTAGYGYNAYSNGSYIVTAISTFSTGTAGNAVANPGTSAFDVVNYGQGLTNSKFGFSLGVIAAASLEAGSGNPGYYFTFSNHTVNYAMWFYVNGEIPPTVSGSPILLQCNLIPTMSPHDVANVIAALLSGEQTNQITTVAATTPIPAGAWFNFTASPTVLYSVWYQVANLPATKPSAITGIPIMVSLLGTETAAQVATATQIAINSYSFAVPDLRGVFLRGNDTVGNWDIDNGDRWAYNNALGANVAGTFEFYQVQNHYHTILTETAGSGNVISGTLSTTPVIATTGDTGGVETRPVNMSVNYFIKY